MLLYISLSDVNRWLEGMTVFWNFNLIKNIIYISSSLCFHHLRLLTLSDMTERQLLT